MHWKTVSPRCSCLDSSLSVHKYFLWWFVKKLPLRQIDHEHKNTISWIKKLLHTQLQNNAKHYLCFVTYLCFVIILWIASSHPNRVFLHSNIVFLPSFSSLYFSVSILENIGYYFWNDPDIILKILIKSAHAQNPSMLPIRLDNLSTYFYSFI